MAAFLQRMVEDLGGQNLGPLAFDDFAEADIFEIGERVQPARMKDWVGDDRAGGRSKRSSLRLQCSASHD